MTRWNLLISDETDRSVRSHLARLRDSNSNLSQFVDRAVRQAIFWETLDTVWKDNERLPPEKAQSLADDALAEARAARP